MKNEPTSNEEIINKISNFIETADIPNVPTSIEATVIEQPVAVAEVATEVKQDVKKVVKDVQQKVKKSK